MLSFAETPSGKNSLCFLEDSYKPFGALTRAFPMSGDIDALFAALRRLKRVGA
jgi:hypothetical protein